MSLEFGTAQRPARGEVVSGDAFLILPGDPTLVALADGLGHGPGAAEAAQRFCDFVRDNASESLAHILSQASQALSSTRGAVAALLRIEQASRRLSFVGVGNIDLRARSATRIRPVSTAGVLGRPLRKVKQYDFELTPGDLLVLHSDGISSSLSLDDFEASDPQTIADGLMSEYGKNYDDATCVVIRFGTLASMDQDRPPCEEQVYRFRHETDAVWCRQKSVTFARQLGFDTQEFWRVAIAVSELVTNAVRYATGGTLTLREILVPREGIEVCVEDEGPGISDIGATLEAEGHDSADLSLENGGLGSGLAAVRRLMDELELSNRPEGGLRVVARRWRRTAAHPANH